MKGLQAIASGLRRRRPSAGKAARFIRTGTMAKRIQADLHIHTTCSDGTFTPRDVVDRAAAAGLTVIAITDHDTMNGVAEARQHGPARDVEVVPGVEISTYHGDQEFHLIGLYVDTVNTAFLERLSEMCRARHERIEQIVDKLRSIGVELDAQDVIDLADGGSPGRAHVAQALKDRGHVSNLAEAFYRYVGDSGPAFVPKRYMSVEEAITTIRAMGGVSILAHPGVTSRDDYIPLFAEMGLHGIEAFYPTYNREQTARYLTMAMRLGLLVAGGSDCHGARRPDLPIGRVRVPGVYVEKIAALAQLLPGSVNRKEDFR